MSIAISGCTEQETQPKPSTTNAIDIKDFAFNPDTITVAKGTTVTWTNKDSAQHTVTGTAFTSETLSQGQSYSYTFNEAGTFEYYCKFHPSMLEKVIVT
ncbi:MAG: cupredoxin family copper-binding protein [Candidatus Methanoperedens sp.]|nr:cupredoxin family copper-binding protein [Candidatus Methanoperedens sp.]